VLLLRKNWNGPPHPLAPSPEAGEGLGEGAYPFHRCVAPESGFRRYSLLAARHSPLADPRRALMDYCYENASRVRAFAR